MPQYTIFSSRDVKSESFGQPFFALHVGLAIRALTDAVNNHREPSDLSNHPEDFILFELGSFDSSTGTITPLEAPRSVVNCLTLVKTA
jgi:hypothetical protein